MHLKQVAQLATTAQVMASSINAFGLKASDATHVAIARYSNDSAADISTWGCLNIWYTCKIIRCNT